MKARASNINCTLQDKQSHQGGSTPSCAPTLDFGSSCWDRAALGQAATASLESAVRCAQGGCAWPLLQASLQLTSVEQRRQEGLKVGQSLVKERSGSLAVRESPGRAAVRASGGVLGAAMVQKSRVEGAAVVGCGESGTGAVLLEQLAALQGEHWRAWDQC